MPFDVIFAADKDDEPKILRAGFHPQRVFIRYTNETGSGSNLVAEFKKLGVRVYQFVRTSYWGAMPE